MKKNTQKVFLNEASNHKITSTGESIFASEKYKNLEVMQTVAHQFSKKGGQYNHEENNVEKACNNESLQQ